MRPIRANKEWLKSMKVGMHIYRKGWICIITGIDYRSGRVELKKLYKSSKKRRRKL